MKQSVPMRRPQTWRGWSVDDESLVAVIAASLMTRAWDVGSRRRRLEAGVRELCRRRVSPPRARLGRHVPPEMPHLLETRAEACWLLILISAQ